MKQAAITIVNYSDEPLVIALAPDKTVDSDLKQITIPKNDSYTLFLDRLESFNWTRHVGSN